MDNLKYIIENKNKIILGVFGIIFYIIFFVFFFSYRSSLITHFNKNIDFPKNIVYIHDNDQFDKADYHEKIIRNYPNELVCSFFVYDNVMNNNDITIIGSDDTIFETGLYINKEYIYFNNLNKINNDECLVSKELSNYVIDEHIKIEDKLIKVAGYLDSSSLLVYMPIEEFLTFTNNTILLDDYVKTVYYGHMIKFNKIVEKSDYSTLQVIFKDYNNYKIFSKDLLVKNAVLSKGLNGVVITLFFTLGILFNIFSIINWMNIIYKKRRSELAIRRVLGATKGNIRKNIFLVNALIGLISSIWGLILGGVVFLIFSIIYKIPFVILNISTILILILGITLFTIIVGDIVFRFENKNIIKVLRGR